MRRRPGTLKQVILFELYWCALMEITTLPLCKRRLYKTGSYHIEYRSRSRISCSRKEISNNKMTRTELRTNKNHAL